MHEDAIDAAIVVPPVFSSLNRLIGLGLGCSCRSAMHAMCCRSMWAEEKECAMAKSRELRKLGAGASRLRQGRKLLAASVERGQLHMIGNH